MTGCPGRINSKIMQIQDIYNVVEKDFEQVNQLINQQLSSDVPLVEKIADYIIQSGGKRLRPLLVLLSSGALGYSGDQHIKLATVIEFLHTATLLHDDVVDTSDMRRGRSTANAKWGNAPSVLVGDFLYARAFQMMVELKSLDIMDCLANATKIIAEGEVFQLTNCKNPDITEENYFQAKRRLFESLCAEEGSSIINVDDSFGQRLAEDELLRGRHLSFGKSGSALNRISDYSPEKWGSSFRLTLSNSEVLEVDSPLAGWFNVQNVAAALLTAVDLGCEPQKLIEALQSFSGIPGRLQEFRAGNRRAFVDFAHTPDALEQVLRDLRPLCEGRLTVVFGCGGGRDRGKRPRMGLVAGRAADSIILTDDNPRSEDPDKIIDEIGAGIPGGVCWQAIRDRREAIAAALVQMKEGDIVLVAGKGHEDYQIYGSEKLPFSDAEIVRQLEL